MLDSLRLKPEWHSKFGITEGRESFLASMGIYVFNRSLIQDLLNNSLSDFGKNVIPEAINSQRVFSFIFHGYWKTSERFASFSKRTLTSLPNCRGQFL